MLAQRNQDQLQCYAIKYMINLQYSKNLIKTYEQLSGITPPKIKHTSLLPSQRQLLKENDNEYFSNQLSKQIITQCYNKQVSKMVSIQFIENSKAKTNQQIRQRRKMMASSQKFYSRKKQNYSNIVKEISAKQSDQDKHNQTFLTIGSHAIRKMDYTATIFSKDYKFLAETHTIMQQRMRGQFNMTTKQRQVEREDEGKVLILKKNNNNKIQDLLSTFKPISQRKMEGQKHNHVMEKVRNRKQAQNLKSVSIQQFIPVRKNTAKKAFVFGLGDKQQNPERMRDKLLQYHDFLWKINYGNGLYIKASQDEQIYRAYIGPGNNSNLIRSILKRRFWWTIADKNQNCNFVWTQLKVNSLFKDQISSKTITDKIYPNQEEQLSEKIKTEPLKDQQQGHEKIFNSNDLLNWSRHMRKYRRSEGILSQKTYKNRAQFLNCKQIVRIQNSSKLIMHNHLQQNFYIGNKKALFYNMRKFYQLQGLNVFDALPLTFHISKGLEDPQFKLFQKNYQDLQGLKRKGEDIKNIWIMKPGENSNRGNGITVCHGIQDIKLRLKSKQKNSDGNLRTFIIQKYMEKPLLYKGRKFDIRHYLLLTSCNGIIKAYWFPQGYIRTSSSLFSLKRGTNLYIHLTNDAVQKNSDQYGKYEKGNKISYQKFQSYLNKTVSAAQNQIFFNDILLKMKHLALQAVKSTFLTLDPQRRQNNFELLGMDFMIDDQLKPWLIQINTNPCLELSSPLLSKIIPTLVEQSFRICVDSIFPPPQEWPSNRKMFINQNILEQNMFQLIFDESIDGQQVRRLYGNDTVLDSNMGKIQEDDEIFQNDGVEEWQQKPQH